MRLPNRVYPVVFLAMGRGDACRLLAAQIGGLTAERSGWLDPGHRFPIRDAIWANLEHLIVKLIILRDGVTGLQLPPRALRTGAAIGPVLGHELSYPSLFS